MICGVGKPLTLEVNYHYQLLDSRFPACRMGSSQGEERSRLSSEDQPLTGQLDADSLVKTVEMDFFKKNY